MLGQGFIRRGGTSEAVPEAVRQAVGGGYRSGWGRLLSVTNAIEPGTWRQRDIGWAKAGRLGGGRGGGGYLGLRLCGCRVRSARPWARTPSGRGRALKTAQTARVFPHRTGRPASLSVSVPTPESRACCARGTHRALSPRHTAVRAHRLPRQSARCARARGPGPPAHTAPHRPTPSCGGCA